EMVYVLRRPLTVLALSALLVAVAGCPEPVPVLHDGLSKTRYTRCYLNANGEKISSSNQSGERGGYKCGCEASVTMFSEVRVDLNINKIPHKMYPVGGKFNTADIDG